MAVSKRLRYEIFRRDNHTCRYCGAKSPDVKITIDHVLPEALGGADTADNLVTACEPCNSGKTSTTPDAPLVADVAEDALRWSGAMARAAQEALEDTQNREKVNKAFLKAWKKHGGYDSDLPDNWRGSLKSLIAAGLPAEEMTECVAIAFDQAHVYDRNRFKYTCGVAWRKVDGLRKRAGEIVGAQQVPEPQDSGEPQEDENEAQERAYYAHIGTAWSWGRVRAEEAPSAKEKETFADTLAKVMDSESTGSGLTDAAVRCGLAGSTNLWRYIARNDEEPNEELTVPVTLPEISRDLLDDFEENQREIYRTGAMAEHGEHSFLAVDYHALRTAWEELLNDRDLLNQATSHLLSRYPADLVDQCMNRSLEEHRKNLGVDFTHANVTLYAVTLLLKSTNS